MTAPLADTIRQQLAFLAELDQLKSVLRQSRLRDGSRRENTAEHSWHVAMFALVLAEHAGDGVDPLHVARLLLVHDIVEIDVGDAPIHDPTIDRVALAAAERQAAERIFALLPAHQRQDFLSLWLEFEAAETPAARFAKAVDRLQPMLLNTLTNGGTWAESRVTEQQVVDRCRPEIERGSPLLWDIATQLVRQYFEGTPQDTSPSR